MERVKRGDRPIPEIAQEHRISPHVIHGWASRQAAAPPSALEVAQLKRENQALSELIGKMTLELWARYKDALERLKQGGKLGSVLLQFPRWFTPTGDNVDYLLTYKEQQEDYDVVIDFWQKDWLGENRCQAIYIEPGSPWENPYIESFNGKLGAECLDRYVFANGREAREIITDWKEEYNQYRPHSSLSYQTPAEFAAGVTRPLDPGDTTPSRPKPLTLRGT